MASPPPTNTPLHPHIADWFTHRYGQPTPVQQQAWPAIARGDHVLATAPTGSGKTLAATLMALQSLLMGRWPLGETSVLYLSPLKALSADVQRNLVAPLQELTTHFSNLGLQVPPITVALRTGDTAQRDRAAMLRRPPEILVTTPESLHILLVSASGRRLLANVRLCILDEIHAVAGNKRGTLLMSAVEELTRIAGPVQRVALSATVKPLEVVARLVGGWEWQSEHCLPRPVTILAPPAHKRFDLQVIDAEMDEFAPNLPTATGDDGGYWPAAARVLRAGIEQRNSTLLFTGSRRTAERLARELNQGQPLPLAWAHHGSLAQELRRTVENRLKAGELKAVCATSSLELGIDVGAVDEVVLVGAPRSVASALQRVGRAGHQVGAISRGRLLPMFGRDIVRCAVLTDLMQAGVIEPVAVPRHPADVLAQVILARVAAQTWQVDPLFASLRHCDAWVQLPRQLFDDVVQMLAGRWAGLRLRELQPRLDLSAAGTLTARKGVATLVARSGGVIADRGYYKMVLHGSGTPIGELDEEFVWERRTGDVFAIGAQSWQVVEKTHDTVSVVPGRRGVAQAPFWRADPDDRDPLVSEATMDWLAAVEPLCHTDELLPHLHNRGTHTCAAVRTLATVLTDSIRALGRLPTRTWLVLELARGPQDCATQAILHAGWGGVVLRPLGLALRAFLQATTGQPWSMQSSDDCLLLRAADGADVAALLDQFLHQDLVPWLNAGLQQSATLGLQFREALGTALVIPRSLAGKRTPLFQTRERSKQVLAAVAHDPSFPLLADALRVCADERFDLPRLQDWLAKWRSGEVQLHVAHTQRPSPLADSVVFLSQGALIYEDDTPQPANAGTQPIDTLAQVAADSQLRPALSAAIAAQLQGKRLRTDADWAPRDRQELLDALAELSPLLLAERDALLTAMSADNGGIDLLLNELGDDLVQLPWGAWCAASEAPVLHQLAAGDADPATATMAVLRYFSVRGPVQAQHAQSALGLHELAWRACVGPLLASGRLLDAVRIEGDPALYLCDPQFVQRALRQRRGLAKRTIKPRPPGTLVLLRAHLHGLLERKSGPAAVAEVLTTLQGLALPLELLETDILPARVPNYRPSDLDAALADHSIQWLGTGTVHEPRVLFAPQQTMAHWQQCVPVPTDLPGVRAWFSDPDAAYTADTLLRRANYDRALVSRELFAAVWAGQVHTVGFSSLRKGLQHGFTAPPAPTRSSGLGRGGMPQSLLPWQGPWQWLPPVASVDAVDAAELYAFVAQTAIARWGVGHRALWTESLPACEWRHLLPALRRMDWSGELQAGAWFSGLPGLQLAPAATEQALVALDRHAQTLWWVHSLDPCSPCGLPVSLPFGDRLPVRAAGSWLVLRGSEPVAVARRGGKQLDLYVQPEAEDVCRIVSAVIQRCQQPGQPRLLVEKVGDVEAARSPYRAALEQAGLVADFRGMGF